MAVKDSSVFLPTIIPTHTRILSTYFLRSHRHTHLPQAFSQVLEVKQRDIKFQYLYFQVSSIYISLYVKSMYIFFWHRPDPKKKIAPLMFRYPDKLKWFKTKPAITTHIKYNKPNQSNSLGCKLYPSVENGITLRSFVSLYNLSLIYAVICMHLGLGFSFSP